MNLRIKRLARDWKTYTSVVSAIASVLTASPAFFKQLTQTFTALKSLPPEARWIGAGVFAIAAAVCMLGAWSKKSILLRPERFVLSAEEPQHLVGREHNVKELATECERHSQVFLVGESGSGKSALVQAGLLPLYLSAGKGSRPAQRLLPLRIDASFLSWEDGLRVELARAIRMLTGAERFQLGLKNSPEAENVFAWLGGLKRDAARQLLIVIDQIDDYAVFHKQQFVSGNTVVGPDKLESSSKDWAAVARLVRDGAVHLLLVCRSDASGILDALRFCQATTFLLPRVESQLISPILDRVTESDAKNPIIEDPEFGWQQLKARLLRDLSMGGISVLPVQLAVALDSLRRFRFLTPVEYARSGGLRGLERLHIERHAREIVRAVGIEELALLAGLMHLVTTDGSKTRSAKVSEFQKALRVSSISLEVVLDHLERGRIVRRQRANNCDYLQLRHDYLARGVREAYFRTNRWEELLRERGEEFTQAFGWRQRWRALLPISAQSHLVVARLQRRFSYGHHRGLALWSLLRLVPLLLLAVLVLGSVSWAGRINQQRWAERMVGGVSDNGDLSEAEAPEWRDLASAPDPARYFAVEYALSKNSIAPKVIARAEIFGHALVGLDPSGVLSRKVVEGAILPLLDQRSTSERYLAAAAIVPFLPHDRRQSEKIASALVERMKTENGFGLSTLGKALGTLSAKLEPKHVQLLAYPLVERIKTEKHSYDLFRLGEALGTMSAKLEPKHVQAGASALIERIKAEKDSRPLSGLGGALGALSVKLEAKDVQAGGSALVERMKTENDSDLLSTLGAALGALSVKLEAKDVQAGGSALVERMKTENDSGLLYTLGAALGALSAKLEPNHAQLLGSALVQRMITEKQSDNLSTLGRALGTLSAKLEPKHVQAGGSALVERMKTENDCHRLSALGEALASLSAKLEPKDVQGGASALLQRMKSEDDIRYLHSLGDALGALSTNLEAKDVQLLASSLVEWMRTENDSYRLSGLGEALGALSAKLEPKDVQGGASALLERMKTENDSFRLSELGEALGALSAKLEPKQVQAGASALLERITESRSGFLFRLGEALASLSAKLEPKQVHAGASALLERIKTENDSLSLSRLAQAFVTLNRVQNDNIPLNKRVQLYADLLKLPLAVGLTRAILLNEVERLTGQHFNGDIWLFVDWATSSKAGQALNLDLSSQRGW